MREARGVFLAIPTHSNAIAPGTEATIARIQIECHAHELKFQECRWIGDAYIARARSALLARYLQTNLSHIFWLDDDVACNPGTFTKMMQFPVDFVAGAYRLKSEEEKYSVGWLEERKYLVADMLTGLLEVEMVPFGFVRLTRMVAEKMYEAWEHSYFAPHEEPTLKCASAFDTEVKDGLYWGEDYLFCKRWRALGGSVWIDPEIQLHHASRREDGKIYSGRIGDWLRKRANLEEKVA